MLRELALVYYTCVFIQALAPTSAPPDSSPQRIPSELNSFLTSQIQKRKRTRSPSSPSSQVQFWIRLSFLFYKLNTRSSPFIEFQRPWNQNIAETSPQFLNNGPAFRCSRNSRECEPLASQTRCCSRHLLSILLLPLVPIECSRCTAEITIRFCLLIWNWGIEWNWENFGIFLYFYIY